MLIYSAFRRNAFLWTLCFICAARALPVAQVDADPNNNENTNAGIIYKGVLVRDKPPTIIRGSHNVWQNVEVAITSDGVGRKNVSMITSDVESNGIPTSLSSIIKTKVDETTVLDPKKGAGGGESRLETSVLTTISRQDIGYPVNRGDIGVHWRTHTNNEGSNVQVTVPGGGSETNTGVATTTPVPVGGPEGDGTGGNSNATIPNDNPDPNNNGDINNGTSSVTDPDTGIDNTTSGPVGGAEDNGTGGDSNSTKPDEGPVGTTEANTDGGTNNETDSGLTPTETETTTTVKPPLNDRKEKLKEYLLGKGCPPDHVERILARHGTAHKHVVNTYRGWRHRPRWPGKWNRKRNRTLTSKSLSKHGAHLTKFSYDSEESLSSCDYSDFYDSSISDSFSDSYSYSFSDSYGSSTEMRYSRRRRDAETEEEDSENLSGGGDSGISGGGKSGNEESDPSEEDNGNESDENQSDENNDSDNQ